MDSTDRADLVRLLELCGTALAGCPETPPQLLLDLGRARDRIARHPIPWAITLHVGHIDHRQGADLYAAQDRSELMSQLAGYCRLWWSQIKDASDPESLDDEKVVRRYFEAEQEEYLMVETIDLPAPSPEVGAIEAELTLVLSTAHIAPSSAQLLDEWGKLEPGKQPIGVADTGFGWFLPSLQLQVEDASSVPPDIAGVIAFARAKDCRFLLLDRDGPEIEGLDRHDW